ncbi:MAG: hypothetical protein JWP27_497 [Flaviaesturariibacter sp.]|nr:hypothetical protein [Flaviaesturariibacter sp.]
MKKVILQFDSLTTLVDFSLTTQLLKCTIDRQKNTLITELSDAEIELARRGFKARILSFTSS